MLKLVLFLNSFYLGLGSFFSFFVAPTLFRVLETQQAGKVVEKVFPVYFAIGFFSSLTTLLIVLYNKSKSLSVISLIATLVVAFQLFFLNPYAHKLKQHAYETFLKVHGLSMALNLAHLILTLAVCVVILLRR